MMANPVKSGEADLNVKLVALNASQSQLRISAPNAMYPFSYTITLTSSRQKRRSVCWRV